MFSIDSDPPHLNSVRFDLPCVLEEIVQSLASQAAIKELELISLIDPPTLVFTRGDPDYLRLLLMNLVSYAIKCADRGNISIQAKAEGETKSYSSVIFSVTLIPVLHLPIVNRQSKPGWRIQMIPRLLNLKGWILNCFYPRNN